MLNLRTAAQDQDRLLQMILPGSLVNQRYLNLKSQMYGDMALMTDAPARFIGTSLVLAVVDDPSLAPSALIICQDGIGWIPISGGWKSFCCSEQLQFNSASNIIITAAGAAPGAAP